MSQQTDLQRSTQYPIQRRALVAQIVDACDESTLIIGGLGAPAWDITAAGDRDVNFPLWGAMGGAVAMGLGLAIAQTQRRVLVITGDGELLMGIGSLATVGVKHPENLAIAVLDNERYGETGMQLTHSAFGADFAAIATASGVEQARTITAPEEIPAAIDGLLHSPGPVLFNFKVRAEALPLVLPPKDGAHLKDRFRLALLGPSAVAAR